MPFYEYECQKCGHQLEAMQKFSERPLRKCPDCGKPALRKLMSSPVFRLKGSGWYETDFKSEKEAKRNLADHPDKEKKKEESKPEAPAVSAKPEAKSEAKPESESKPAVATRSTAKRTRAAPRAKRPAPRRPK
jgi:putative FmdB family regulatory protein